MVGGLAITVLVGAVVLGRRGEPATLSYTGPEATRRFLVMASTFKRFPMGFKPYGEPREGLKVLTVDAPPRRLLTALPRIIRGDDTRWLADNGYRRDDLDSFGIAWEGDFVLDGEPYKGGDLTVRQGPSLEFVIP